MSEEAEAVVTESDKKKSRRRKIRWLTLVFTTLIAVIISIPAFIILHRYVDPIYVGEQRIDHFLTFIPLLAFMIYIVARLRLLFYILCSIGLIWIAVLNINGDYSWREFWHDSKTTMFALRDGAVKIDFLERNEPFSNEDRMRAAIDYKSKTVMDFARESAVKHFEEYDDLAPGRKVIQSFSIFRELNNRWVYVHDPAFEDYYAFASETLDHLGRDGKFKGDCDDYSITMAACVKAIGGEVRLVRTRVDNGDGTTTGHIYPEVKIGDRKDLESAAYMIKEVLFSRWAKGKDIHYHVDRDGFVWLNFDYNDEYPGGRYQSTVRVSEIDI